MVASNKTIVDVYRVIKRHVPAFSIGALLAELATVRGNASFTQTVQLLLELHTSTSPEAMKDRERTE